MKYFTLLFAISFVGIAVGQPNSQKLVRAHAECVEATQVNEELFRDGKWQSAQNDTKFKEYMFCFNKKMGYQNEAGDFQKAELKSSLAINSNQENVNDIVEKCAVKKSTPQESAYQCMKCIDDNRPKN